MAKVIFNIVLLTIFIAVCAGQMKTEQVTSVSDSNISELSSDVAKSSKSYASTSESTASQSFSESTPINVVSDSPSTRMPVKTTEKPVSTPLTSEDSTSTTESTTPTPEITTTTPTPELTTTPTPELTTTPTPELTTTPTEPSTTVTPLPSSHNYYNVTNGEVYCIMFSGDFSFSVTYNIGENKTNETLISLPKPGSQKVEVTGSCEKKNSQWIKVSWGHTFPKTSLMLNFQSVANTTWKMPSIQAIIPLANSKFINATDSGKSLNVFFNTTQLSFGSSYNHSYQCYAELNNINGNVTLEQQTYLYAVTASTKAMQLQAFNEVPKIDDFDISAQCSEDKIADLVPIGVGCALGALTAIVLVAYFVARRRKRLAYQSV